MNRRSLLVALALIATTLVGVTPVAHGAATLFVDINDGDCNDTSGPIYCSIQSAVNDASDGDTIQVAVGTYVGTDTYVVDISGIDLTITGAGQGATIIDGEDTRGGVRVTDADVSLSGVTVTNGLAVLGAGILIQSTGSLPNPLLTLTDVTVDDNHGSAGVGGIFVMADSDADLIRVTVSGNTTPGQGAGLLQQSGGAVSITDSTFTGNVADGSGGAIAIGTGTMVISGSTFHLNEGGLGGAISSSSTMLEIMTSTFTNNTSTNAGGAIYTDSSSVDFEVTQSYFAANNSVTTGGAISDGADGFFANNTFFNNEAQGNGGALSSDGVVTNSTFAINSSEGTGGALYAPDSGLSLRNSILHSNSAIVDGPDCYEVVSQGYNLINDDTDCLLGGTATGDQVGAEAELSDPADNGGPTFTMAIGVDSDARDGGNPASPGSGGTACESHDQRFRPRADARCDIGAYEAGTVIRYGGTNRYATAAAVSAGEHPGPEPHTFIATGFNFPDALAGAVPAGIIGVPLLLVDTGIPGPTAAELTRLDPFLISILGGTTAVSGATETALAPYADNVERVAASNRYLTAVAISMAMFGTDGSADVVYIATGLGFADALAAAPAAVAGNGPVLLVDGTSLNGAVADEIQRLTPDRIVVVGGTSVISDAVLTALDALQGGDVVERIAGANRYATAVAISEDAFPDGATHAYIATGLNFPDALAGAAAAGTRGAPILLVPGSSIPTVVANEIERLGVNVIVILGGTAVVTTGVEDALAALIGAS